MVNNDKGLTQFPSQPSTMLIQPRPSIQLSEGHLKYFPAVDRLSANPMHIPVGVRVRSE
jgi:hypothetical protein